MKLAELLSIAQMMACMLSAAGGLTTLFQIIRALTGHPYSSYRDQAGLNLMIIGIANFMFLFVLEIVCKHVGII